MKDAYLIAGEGYAQTPPRLEHPRRQKPVNEGVAGILLVPLLALS